MLAHEDSIFSSKWFKNKIFAQNNEKFDQFYSNFCIDSMHKINSSTCYSAETTSISSKPALKHQAEASSFDPSVENSEKIGSSSNLQLEPSSDSNDNLEFIQGIILFFNEIKQFGFIKPIGKDKKMKNIFFHYEDIKGAKFSRKMLRKSEKELDISV